MKKLVLALMAGTWCLMAQATDWFVKADGVGLGTSWDDAGTLHAVLANESIGEGDVIYLAAGDYAIASNAVSTVAVTLKGGYAGTSGKDLALSDRETVLDGAKTTTNILDFTSIASGTIGLERLTVTRAFRRGFYKTGAANVRIEGCKFVNNGHESESDYNSKNYTGRGCYLSGTTAASEIFITNTLFAGQNVRSTEGFADQSGMALYITGAKYADIVSTSFITNGTLAGKTARISGRNKTMGMALYANNAPIRVVDCAFRGNGGIGDDGGHGGLAVYLTGSSYPSAFTNCAFVGNFQQPWFSSAPGHGGSICVNLANASGTVDIDTCTFAYNIVNAKGGHSSGGVFVMKGAAKVRNSIFYGNLVRSSATYAGADLYLRSKDGSIDADYCRFGGNSSSFINAASGVTPPVPGPNCTFGDPLFVTGLDKVLPLLTIAASSVSYPLVGDAYAYAAGTDFAAIDVHLKSAAGRWNGSAFVSDEATSPAIDAGDPAHDYGAETSPNGDCVNLGAYGNTPEASRTMAVAPALGEVAVDSTCDYTQPHFAVTLGGEGAYLATVKLYYGLTDGGADESAWDGVRTLTTTAGNGEELAFNPQVYFAKGDRVYWRVVMTVKGTDIYKEGRTVMTLDRPPWYGKGGDPDAIVHCRAGATGKGDGTSWTDAAPTLADAFALVTDTKRTIWFAGNPTSAEEPLKVSLSAAADVLGGFTGTEALASERPAGAKSVFDGDTLYSCLWVENSAAVSFRDFVFTRGVGVNPVFRKIGAGDVALYDCEIVDNGYGVKCPSGRGVCISGKEGGKTVAVVSNCLFACNCYRGNVDEYQGGPATALSVNNLGLAQISDCLFITNGLSAAARWMMRNDSKGTALYANAAPVAVRNCRFVGNRACCNDPNTGSIVYLYGNCDGAVFSNCLWTANEVYSWNPNSEGNGGGMVCIAMASAARTATLVNCTIAYNIVNGGAASGAVNVPVTNGGKIIVRNSILWGNAEWSAGGGYSEVSATAAGQVDIDWSLIDGTGPEYVIPTAGYVSIGDNVYVADPYFVTTSNEVAGTVTPAEGFGWPRFVSRSYFTPEGFELVKTANLHVRGTAGYTDEATGKLVRYRLPKGVRQSQAVDGGPKLKVGLCEPQPNGKRINLGYYGNTPWATRSVTCGLMLIVE